MVESLDRRWALEARPCHVTAARRGGFRRLLAETTNINQATTARAPSATTTSFTNPTSTSTTMTRHSLVPASAPTSPAATRSKPDRLVPSTPQRPVHPHLRQFSSPYTPVTNVSSPYTPISLRSFSSSNSSNLATPASANSRRRLSLSLSPEVNLNAKSLADIAENWRSRANENGIKVTSGKESQYQGECMRPPK